MKQCCIKDFIFFSPPSFSGYEEIQLKNFLRNQFAPWYPFSYPCYHPQSKSESVSCSVLSDSLNQACSSDLGILQVRILEWVVIPFSRGSS